MRYLDAALGHLGAGYLNTQVIALADRALTAPGVLAGDPRLEVLARKADCLNLLGRRDEQQAALLEAIGLADTLGGATRRAEFRSHLGRLHHNMSDNDRALPLLREALELALQAGDPSLEGNVRTNLDPSGGHGRSHVSSYCDRGY